MTVIKYRIFVVITFIVLAMSVSIDLIWQRDLVSFVSEFSESLLDVSIVRNNLFFAFFAFMLFCAIYSFIGLIRLKGHARYLFLTIFLFSIPINLLLSVSVQSSFSLIFNDIGLLLSGVLLTLTFTEPVKFYFR